MKKIIIIMMAILGIISCDKENKSPNKMLIGTWTNEITTYTFTETVVTIETLYGNTEISTYKDVIIENDNGSFIVVEKSGRERRYIILYIDDKQLELDKVGNIYYKQ